MTKEEIIKWMMTNTVCLDGIRFFLEDPDDDPELQKRYKEILALFRSIEHELDQATLEAIYGNRPLWAYGSTRHRPPPPKTNG